MYDVIIIGAGAAGMMAAIHAAGNGAKVLVLEKNEKAGKKIYITGKGRCNVTNAAPMEEVLANVNTNPRFLYGSFAYCTNQAVCELLEAHGLELKIERGNRVFPVSDHSSDVIGTLIRAMNRLGVKLRLNSEVKEILYQPLEQHEPKDPKQRIRAVRLADGSVLETKTVLLASGGLSYPATGSTGDGHRFAKESGLAVTACYPSLVPLEVKEAWIGELQGLSLKNITATFSVNGKPVYSGLGELMFTHFGITGPLVLSASALLTDQCTAANEVRCEIDMKPALTEKQLDERVLRDFAAVPNKQLKNALDKLLPQKMIPLMIRRAGLSGELCIHEITKEQRKALVQTIKCFSLEISKTRGFKEAVITKGGISVKEVNPKTLEVKSIRGLYVAGELLDLDAMTGGYNLQIAWSTGALAGFHAARAALADVRKR
ncbi:MAG: NAD(P)/FAD-dependent oxidoreductase [Eubacteriales bacterium]|nr:NAD(P)/FAD-dependent oxidoreductase [Eubacteriales bacterium]